MVSSCKEIVRTILVMEIHKPSFFRNPIQDIRDTIGLIIFIFALIILFSGIGMILLGDHFYGGPMANYPLTYELDPSSDHTLNISLPVLSAGKDYDIKMEFKVIPVSSDPASSVIDLGVKGSAVGLHYEDSDRLAEQEFNSTLEMSMTKEFPHKLEQYATISYFISVDQAEEISSIVIKINVYENPNRAIFKLFSTVGILLVFIGILFMIIAGIIAGKQRCNRFSSHRNRLGKGDKTRGFDMPDHFKL